MLDIGQLPSKAVRRNSLWRVFKISPLQNQSLGPRIPIRAAPDRIPRRGADLDKVALPSIDARGKSWALKLRPVNFKPVLHQPVETARFQENSTMG
jgi:hypothetical protein